MKRSFLARRGRSWEMLPVRPRSYIDGVSALCPRLITRKQFLAWHNDPFNYRPASRESYQAWLDHVPGRAPSSGPEESDLATVLCFGAEHPDEATRDSLYWSRVDGLGDINVPGAGAVRVAHAAIRHDSVLEDVLAREADVSVRTDGGHTPLWLAAYEGATDSVVRLLNAGADPNAVDDQYGNPPLWYAVWSSKRDEMIPPLLKHGADPLVFNQAGESPYTSLVSHYRSFPTESENRARLTPLIEKMDRAARDL